MPPVPVLDLAIRQLQRAYPQIYLACHVRHTRAARSTGGLSEREAAILAHLDELSPVGAKELALHLGVAQSTVTEAIDRLERLGMATRERSRRDRRGVELRITDAGARAMQSDSVLDRDRLAAVLARLSGRERAAAVRGLGLLARASREQVQAESAAAPRARRTRRPTRKRGETP
jgi:DNA-binding MarR family transcriptional regulator